MDRVGDVALPQIDHEYRRKSMTPTPTSKSEVFGLIAKGNCYFHIKFQSNWNHGNFFQERHFWSDFYPKLHGQNVYFCPGKKMKWIFLPISTKWKKKEWIGKKGNEIKEVKACSLVPLMDKIYCPGSNWFQDISVLTKNLHMNILKLALISQKF